MMGGLLESGVKNLGPRFFLVGLVPAAVGVFAILALSLAGAPGASPDLARLIARVRALTATDTTVLVVGVVAIALGAQPLQHGLVRLLEGYWGGSGLAGRVAGWLRRRQLDARDRLERGARVETTGGHRPGPAELAALAGAEHALQRRFPARERVLPTALGNALRAGEDRAAGRYGLDGVVMWPRLYPLLSGRLAAALDDQRNQLDFSARACVVMFLTAAVTAALLWRYPTWYVVPLACVGLAALAYRAAVTSAITYGVLLETAFDLHRFDLLTALHQPLPLTLQDEIAANRALSGFLRDGGGATLAYQHERAPSSRPQSGAVGKGADEDAP